jgi:threonylcarbamoyladenosine tRNA methylthiotransferase MtaB
VFTYSERPSTYALQLKEVVPMQERNKRSKMLHILSDKKRRHFYENQLHTMATVLFENDVEEGKMHGFTENYIRVSAKYDPILINEFKQAKLVSVNEKGVMEVEEAEEEVLH